ncbi:MAG: AMP-binding protein [Tranquillimonas sp.]
MPADTEARRLFAAGASWQDLRDSFVWRVPDRFNIAERCCSSWAQAAPDRTALIDVAGDGQIRNWSYGELERAANRLALALGARGIGRGDRVALLLPQGPDVLIAHFAIGKLGAVALPLFSLFGPDALAFRLSDSGARAAIVEPGSLDKLSGLDLPDLRVVLSTGPARAPILSFWDEIGRAGDRQVAAETAAEDPAMLIYTSGTTGDPKGALHAQRFLLGHLPVVELAFGGFPQPGDIGWTPADWAWIGGLMDLALPCLYYGVPLVSHRMRKFDPDAAFDLIGRHRVRALFLPPTALKLMRQARVPDEVDIRAIGSGGESLGADLLAWGQDRLGAEINEFYGQTECNLVLCSSQARGVLRPGTIGRAVPGHDVAVIDDAGRALPPGRTGEIAVRRPDPAMFLGYWNQPEKTAARFAGDWMRTGDLGVADADGYVTYVARDDDVITSAGYRIGPTEIENCLTGDPDVVMAAAVGLPDPVRTEIVTAFVVARDGTAGDALADRLIRRVAERVSPHLAPRRVVWVTSLPMTATGKIMRRALRAEPPAEG